MSLLSLICILFSSAGRGVVQLISSSFRRSIVARAERKNRTTFETRSPPQSNSIENLLHSPPVSCFCCAVGRGGRVVVWWILYFVFISLSQSIDFHHSTDQVTLLPEVESRIVSIHLNGQKTNPPEPPNGRSESKGTCEVKKWRGAKEQTKRRDKEQFKGHYSCRSLNISLFIRWLEWMSPPRALLSFLHLIPTSSSYSSELRNIMK